MLIDHDSIVQDPARLEALWRTLLLDSPAEQAFDRLTRLASKILRAPIALVSLVDRDRQFFKSCVGLPEPWGSLRQTPLSHSFCQHTITSNEPLLIEDARKHPLVSENPAIDELGVIAYAGIPLMTTGGVPLGSFCVIDTHPRTWTDEEVDVLRELAASVVTEIELRMASQEAQRRANEAERERTEKLALLDSVGEGIFGVDLQGRCTFANQTVARMLGYAPEELFGKDMHKLCHHSYADGSPYPKEACPIYRVMETGHGIHATDEIIWRRDGSSFPAQYSSYPVMIAGRIEGTVVALRDISEQKRAAAELHRREQSFAALAEHSPDVIARFDQDLRFIYINSAVERAFGIPVHALSGKTLPEAGLLQEQDSCWLTSVQQVFDTGDEQSVDVAFSTAAGTRWYQARLVPEFGPNGTPEFVLAVARDITEHKHTEEGLKFLADVSVVLSASLDYKATLSQVVQLAVPTLGDWCFVDIVTEDGSIQCLDVAHADPTKAGLADAIKRLAPSPDWHTPQAHVLRSGAPIVIPDLSQVPIEEIAQNAEHEALLDRVGVRSIMVVPLCARGRTLGVLTFQITEPGRAYGPSDLAFAEELARRAALAIDNARLYHEAQEALRSRSELLSIVSHDLKTPLVTIKGYAELARRRVVRAGGPDAERVVDGLAKIDAATNKMTMQINELLDIARLQLDQPLDLHVQPVNLVALVQQICAEQQHAAKRHTIRFEAVVPELIGAYDATRLERVIVNLLDNAIKYSPDGGVVHVRITCEEEQDRGAWVVIAVQDWGVGIPAGDLPHIFERFHRAKNVAGTIGGTGIGLASARYIVEQHGGSIDVSSTEGVGSTFTVRLPLRPSYADGNGAV